MAETKVTPWEVSGKVDYDKLTKQFGTKIINDDLRRRLARLASEQNILLERGVYFSHRDLDLILADHESKKGFFLYTGRGPSGPMHIGHLLPMVFTKWLQDRFGVNLYVQITDDEKFLLNRERELADVDKIANDNILDIAALGFDPNKTFIFKDTQYMRNMYPIALRVARQINLSQVRATFGFESSTNVGMAFFPAIEIIPTMFEKKRCLIPAAIDQDPFWRLQRDIAEGLGFHKAAQIHGKFLPPLTGAEGKMSASQPETAIYLSDDPKTVRNKIMKYAFSGGQESIELHRKLGGNINVDVSYAWLRDFFEQDPKKLKKIGQDYTSGKMLTGELKGILVDKVNSFLEQHRANREKAKEHVDSFMHGGALAQRMWKTVHN